MLLNALKVTHDPKKLRQLIGVKTVADVYRTLDKMAMRKEYHAALAREGISFDWLVKKTKAEIDNEQTKSGDKINAIKMLLKSLGMDNYQQEGLNGGNWEDALLKLTEKEEKPKISEPGQVPQIAEPKEVKEVYEVNVPEMPESMKKKKDRENKIGKSLYE